MTQSCGSCLLRLKEGFKPKVLRAFWSYEKLQGTKGLDHCGPLFKKIERLGPNLSNLDSDGELPLTSH